MRYFKLLILLFPTITAAQIKWKNVDSLFQPLPPSVHVYYTEDSLDGKPNKAYYVEADLKDKRLEFTTDTTKGRRFTPSQFFERNNKPLLVVNCTFFEFVHNSNLNLVMRKGKPIAYNKTFIPLKGKDTFTYAHTYPSAMGITKRGNADVAWTFTDSTKKVYASQLAFPAVIDSFNHFALKTARQKSMLNLSKKYITLSKWKMQTAVGGGPVLLQQGDINITNNEERRFGGKAINDRHPRTAMGYTKDNKLIILVIQGRFLTIAEGATLTQEAQILKDLGCWEALNLDGGGSSCLLVNGKQTITPSDKQGEQRPVPAVFMIKAR